VTRRLLVALGLLLATGIGAGVAFSPGEVDAANRVGEARIYAAGYGHVYKATLSLNASTIVGSTAGTLGHADGVTVLSGVTGKRIVIRDAWLQMTFATAAYTGGGVVSLRYSDNATVAASATVSAANSFGATSSRTSSLPSAGATLSTNGATAGIGAGIVIAAGAAFTQPGTAAGTAVLTVYYSLVD
jgi:hypothetical protein